MAQARYQKAWLSTTYCCNKAKPLYSQKDKTTLQILDYIDSILKKKNIFHLLKKPINHQS